MIRNSRYAIALALIFWCAGTGCMIVSYARAEITGASSSQAHEHMVRGAGASTDAHACCKAHHKAERGRTLKRTHRYSSDGALTQISLPESSVPGGVMNCCPLTSGSIVVASQSHSNGDASVLSHGNSSLLALTSSNPRPVAIPLWLPNLANSYLLGCAFLI